MNTNENLKMLSEIELKYGNIKKYMTNIDFKMDRLHPELIETSTNPYTAIYLERLNALLTNVQDSFSKNNPLQVAQ